MKTEYEALGERIKALHQPVMDWLVEQGVESIRVDGYTVYIHRQLWASYTKPNTDGLPKAIADQHNRSAKEALIATMKGLVWELPPLVPGQPNRRIDFGDLVHEDFNTQTLSSLVRELPVDEQGDPMLPPELAGLLTITNDPKPRKRKSK